MKHFPAKSSRKDTLSYSYLYFNAFDPSNFLYQVRLDEATLTVSPFSGEAIISPTDKNDANDARKLLRVSILKNRISRIPKDCLLLKLIIFPKLVVFTLLYFIYPPILLRENILLRWDLNPAPK